MEVGGGSKFTHKLLPKPKIRMRIDRGRTNSGRILKSEKNDKNAQMMGTT